MTDYTVSECEDVVTTMYALAQSAPTFALKQYYRKLEQDWQAELHKAKEALKSLDVIDNHARYKRTFTPFGERHSGERSTLDELYETERHMIVPYGGDQRKCTRCKRIWDRSEDAPDECR